MALGSSTSNILQITGAGTTAGSYNVGIRATNADGNDVHNFYISIGRFDPSYGLGGIVDALEYAVYSNSPSSVGVIVAVQMDATGWSLNQLGTWPDGISLSGTRIFINGAVLGVSYNVVVIRATNSFGSTDNTYQVTVVDGGGGGASSGYKNSVY
jgi:hypothetical protein